MKLLHSKFIHSKMYTKSYMPGTVLGASHRVVNQRFLWSWSLQFNRGKQTVKDKQIICDGERADWGGIRKGVRVGDKSTIWDMAVSRSHWQRDTWEKTWRRWGRECRWPMAGVPGVFTRGSQCGWDRWTTEHRRRDQKKLEGLDHRECPCRLYSNGNEEPLKGFEQRS